MIRSWASGKLSTLQVLAEREAIYRLLAQTTPENLSKDLNQYTLNPCSRYPNLNLQAVLPSQVRSLYVTDGKIEESILDIAVEVPKKKKRRGNFVDIFFCISKDVSLFYNCSVFIMNVLYYYFLPLPVHLHFNLYLPFFPPSRVHDSS